ncbi:MAG: phosphohydrolase, partial [Thermodesulfobacteriota bacterium]
KKEGGALPVILCAAYLYDIGVVDAERNHGSSDPGVQEKEGRGSARLILEKLKAGPALVDEVCEIIGRRYNPGSEPSLNFKVVFDSNRIAELEEERKENPIPSEVLEEIIERSFMTESGREEAKAVLIQG